MIGAWVGGAKEDNAGLAQIYYEHEFITANLDYTLLSANDHSTNILRQIDEITACIEHLKNFLVSSSNELIARLFCFRFNLYDLLWNFSIDIY